MTKSYFLEIPFRMLRSSYFLLFVVYELSWGRLPGASILSINTVAAIATSIDTV